MNIGKSSNSSSSKNSLQQKRLDYFGRSQTTSKFLGKYIILTAIQLQLYQKSVEEITNIL